MRADTPIWLSLMATASGVLESAFLGCQLDRFHAVQRACHEYRTAYALSAMSDLPVEQQQASSQSTVCRQPCPMCQSLEPPIDVHGHSQCATCKINIDPCCGGAAFDLPAAS